MDPAERPGGAFIVFSGAALSPSCACSQGLGTQRRTIFIRVGNELPSMDQVGWEAWRGSTSCAGPSMGLSGLCLPHLPAPPHPFPVPTLQRGTPQLNLTCLYLLAASRLVGGTQAKTIGGGAGRTLQRTRHMN